MGSPGKHFPHKPAGCRMEKFLQVAHQDLMNELIVVLQPILRGKENQLACLQCLRHRQSNAVGVNPVRFAVAIKAQGRKDRNNSAVEQRLKKFRVDTLDLPRK